MRGTPSSRSPAAAGAAEEIPEAEHVAEDVGEIAELGEDRRIEAGVPAGGGAHAGVAEAIVETALLAVAADRVGLGGFLEAFFGGLVARIAVRVPLQRQLAIGNLDFGLGRAAIDAERFLAKLNQ